MMYVALMTGSGEGCDYTIACNRQFVVFEAADAADALEQCKCLWTDYGGSNGEPRVEAIELYAIAYAMPVPVDQWNRQDEEETDREQAIEELRRLKTRVAKLEKKIKP